MTRRRLIALVGGAAGYLILWPPSPRAQSTGKIPRIGVLWAQGNKDLFLFEAPRQGLSQLGYIDGKTINLEHRFVGDRYDRFDALVAELVDPAFAQRDRALSRLGHLGDDADEVRVPALEASFDEAAHLVDVEGLLGNQRHVCA